MSEQEGTSSELSGEGEQVHLGIPSRNPEEYVKNTMQEVNGGTHAYVPLDRAYVQFEHDSSIKYGHHSVHYFSDKGTRMQSLHWHKTYGTSEHEGPDSVFDSGMRGKALKGRFEKQTNNVIRFTLKNVANAISNHYGLTPPRN